MNDTIRPQTRRERRAAERAEHRHAPRGRARQPSWWQRLPALTAAGLLGGLLVVVLALNVGRTPAPSNMTDDHVLVARAPATLASDGFVLGAPDAPVTIDVYEDFQCPACKRWGDTVFPALAGGELARGEARLVFHDFAFLGPESEDAARAGYAASRQGRFWDMWATLYANQGQENSGAYTPERLATMASHVGLDASRFATDMDSAAAQAHVQDGERAASASGVDSTPSLFVDGTPVGGSYDELAAAIADARR